MYDKRSCRRFDVRDFGRVHDKSGIAHEKFESQKRNRGNSKGR